MLEVAALTIFVLVGWAVAAVALVVLKALLWIILLPIRLLLYVFVVPILLIKLFVGGVLLLLLAPLFALGMVAGLIGLAAAVLAPLLPVAFLILILWLLVKLTGAATAPTSA